MNSKKAIIILILLEFLIMTIAIALDGFTLTALQTITRFSGRISLGVFSLIFLWQHQPEKLNSWLSPNPYLAFAIVHGIHLIILLSYVSLSGVPLIPIRLMGGFLAYSIIFAMPYVYSLKDSEKISDKNFFRFQNIYQYYIWFIFFMTYLPRVRGTALNVGGNYWEYVILMSWVIVMLMIKITVLLKFNPARNA